MIDEGLHAQDAPKRKGRNGNFAATDREWSLAIGSVTGRKPDRY
jgi:hypothetical protein